MSKKKRPGEADVRLYHPDTEPLAEFVKRLVQVFGNDIYIAMDVDSPKAPFVVKRGYLSVEETVERPPEEWQVGLDRLRQAIEQYFARQLSIDRGSLDGNLIGFWLEDENTISVLFEFNGPIPLAKILAR